MCVLLCPCHRKATCGCDDESLAWVSFPLSCIKAVVHADEDPLALMLAAKVPSSTRTRTPVYNDEDVDPVGPGVL